MTSIRIRSPVIEALRRSADEPAAPGSKSTRPGGAGEGAARIRRLLLAVLQFGIAGLLIELFLLEHTEEVLQWVPIVLLGGGFLCGVGVAVRPTHRTVRLFQAAMTLLVCAGTVGLGLHYNSNAVFELEIDPTVGGLALVGRALLGGTPALAPGAAIQLGLLGLIYAYRHPALGGEDPAAFGSAAGAAHPYQHRGEIS